MAFQTVAPSSSNRLLGRGSVYLARIDSTTNVRGPFFHIGNAPDLNITTEIRELVNRSFMHADSRVLDRITLETTVRYRMSTQEFNQANVAMALMALNSSLTQTGGSISNEALGTVSLGGVYKLANREVSSVVLSDGGSLTLGTDYIVLDADEGIVQITVDSSATPGAALTATYTAAALAAGEQAAVFGGTDTNIKVSLIFVGQPAYGPKWNAYGWKGSIKPQDAMALIQGDTLGTMGLEIVWLDDSAGAYGGSETNPLHMLVPASATAS